MSGLLLLAAAVQLLAWRFILSRAFPSPDPSPVAGHTAPVSVIVCFRNETAGLEACLRSILAQHHPHFEVIAVDDNSTDASPGIVRRLQQTFTHLRLVTPGPTRPGKKDALTAGIGAAAHDILLLTDADCIPATPEWLTRMTAPLTVGAELVLGCSPYQSGNGLLNRWQRFEATYVALQYQGFARTGHPYMSVGRNLAYRKSFFRRAEGFTAHAHVPGGDDDLLINRHAQPATTVSVTHPASWTYSRTSYTWQAYLRQKLRHQSVGPLYRPLHRVLLAALALSHGLFYLVGLYLLFTLACGWALLLYALRAAIVLGVYRRHPVRKFLGGDAGAGFVLLGDALLAPYYLFLAVATALPPGRW
ncbi:glycosyltransferase involved in cell wall biosynthesis [Lewinella aquimaris]|uniref:Glycosyltransferase involved in cell wall biosynthesis n=1 Tax=Neolewinella aquimaris TaxID=1835722 RepID=A0A840E785_9BACT|nr:glycosyltransferase [Neolewinella aquimaris]MBB4079485.1 glycosyltransferase involved in cell wall biosynthesis [Neolewinella aquimaris]